MVYLNHLPDNFLKTIIHTAPEASTNRIYGAEYLIFKSGKNRLLSAISIFFKARKLNPEVILFHSMLFPIELLLLKLIMKNSVKILVQNHADLPSRHRIKKMLQIYSARFVTGFLFVSKKQSLLWKEEKIISGRNKVFEIMEGTTLFSVKSS